MTIDNHCIIVDNLSVCTEASESCKYFKPEPENVGCFYRSKEKCFNAVAVNETYEKMVLKKEVKTDV